MTFTHLLIALPFSLLPALGWLYLYYKKDKLDPEPKKIIAQTFFVGIAMSFPFLFLRHILGWLHLDSLLWGGFLSVIVLAALEEIAKISSAIWVVSRHKAHFNQIIDGVMYAVTAALGFAFVENLLYLAGLQETLQPLDYFTVIGFRSLGTMLAHTLFSACAGLLWAYAYFSKKISPFDKKDLLTFEMRDWFNREILSLHILRKNILRALPSRRGGHEKKALVLEGIVLAIFLHVIFNVTTTLELAGKNLTFLLVPFLMAGLFYTFYLFAKKSHTEIFQVI